MRLISALTAVGLALSACSSDDQPREAGIGKVALELARSRFGKRKVEQAADETATAAPQRPTREQLAALGRPVIWVAVPRVGLAQPALELARNGAFNTYMAGDQTSVTLQDGMIVATRGLFGDLIAQDLSTQPRDIFTGRFPKAYTRDQRHLNGEGRLDTFTYNCAIAPEPVPETIEVFGQSYLTTRLTELCRNDVRAFQNDYWIDSRSRRVVKTNQSVSRDVGHLTVEVITPGR